MTPKLVPFPIDATPESIDADALLMIGDRAMHPPAGEYVETWDLGDVWCRWAELPFVFAMWVARGAGFQPANRGAGFQPANQKSEVGSQKSEDAFLELAAALGQSRDLGVANIERIARAEHARCGLSYDECLSYLRDHLHFTLGPRERAGLRLFQEHAERRGLIPSGPLSLWERVRVRV
jgi:chorismate dehydratase